MYWLPLFVDAATWNKSRRKVAIRLIQWKNPCKRQVQCSCCDALELMDADLSASEPYWGQNAIIMAAGLSSRFAPLPYEKPKGIFWGGWGEVLAEQQIGQLKEADILAGSTNMLVLLGVVKFLEGGRQSDPHRFRGVLCFPIRRLSLVYCELPAKFDCCVFTRRAFGGYMCNCVCRFASGQEG